MACLVVARVQAYGPAGHEMVGAIADGKLAGTSAGRKVQTLLGGVSLARAANLADDLKFWDKKKGAINPGSLRLTNNHSLELQLFAFWQANPATDNNPTNKPSHHWFHYTDVPVEGVGKYADGPTGRSQWDVVQMMRYCIRVLRGEESEENARKITKPVAAVLLAHYVGDIHQPLHVGAQYFDEHGQPVNPDAVGGKGTGDQGGNSLFLSIKEIPDLTMPRSRMKMHGFWDNQAVTVAFNKTSRHVVSRDAGISPEVTRQEIARYFIRRKPPTWKSGSARDVMKWPENWANEMLPLAREAHRRLEYVGVRIGESSGVAAAVGTAKEKLNPGGESYAEWAGNKVNESIHRAGWRLAELLTAIVK